LVKLGYDVVGTGEPGWRNRYRMVERFTQDIDGIEVRPLKSFFKSYCVDMIKPPRSVDSVKEVLENRYLRAIALNSNVKLKAAVTDPVTIGMELIANNPRLIRGYPNLFMALAEALTPIVEQLSSFIDILQIDCPVHIMSPVKEPWIYVNELVKHARGKPVWLHVDGGVERMMEALISKYKVDVIAINLFGSEEEENLRALAKNNARIREKGKKIGVSCVNTQIQDAPEKVESRVTVLKRLKRVEATFQGELEFIECIMPGCGLNLLPKTSRRILERVVSTVNEIGWKKHTR